MAKDYHTAHVIDKDSLDPQLNGPFLDDIRAAEEDARRKARYRANKLSKKDAKKLNEATPLEIEEFREQAYRQVAEEVDKVILKDDDQVKMSDAHNPNFVGRVPVNPGSARGGVKDPKAKSKLPTEEDSIPPVSTKAEEKATEVAGEGNRRRAEKKPATTRKRAHKKTTSKKATVKKQTQAAKAKATTSISKTTASPRSEKK